MQLARCGESGAASGPSGNCRASAAAPRRASRFTTSPAAVVGTARKHQTVTPTDSKNHKTLLPESRDHVHSPLPTSQCNKTALGTDAIPAAAAPSALTSWRGSVSHGPPQSISNNIYNGHLFLGKTCYYRNKLIYLT